MIKNELKNLFKNKILLISVIAITFIPIIYTSIFDKSLWDPYGGIKNLPVAVVNEDENVEIIGQKVNVGEKVINNLKKNHDLDWHFVSKKQAEKGIKDMDYYTIITLPKDFSASAVSVMNNNPQKMEITYTTNGSYNYIGKEISEVAANELEMKVRDQVVKAYVSAVDDEASKMIGSLEQAADGSNQLSSGTNQLATGISQYTKGVSEADSGSVKLAEGTAELEAGVGPLSSGVVQLDAGSKKLSGALNSIEKVINTNRIKISEVDVGMATLSDAAQLMADSLQNFENNLNPEVRTQLSSQIKTAKGQLSELVTNSEELNQFSVDASKLEKQNQEISEKLETLTGEFESVNNTINSQINSLIQGNEELSEDSKAEMIQNINHVVDSNLTTAEQTINSKVNDVNNNLTTLSTLTATLAQQASEVSNVTSSMAKNTKNIETTFNEVEKGSQQIESAVGMVPTSMDAQTIVDQLNKLSATLRIVSNDIPTALPLVQQLASGSTQLTNGLGELEAKIPTLSSGISQLNSGSIQLENGLNELNEKSPELVSGVTRLKSGAAELARGLDAGVNKAESIKITHKTINQFTNPTSLKNDRYTKVNNYGEALAPYIMSLALFVGCMLFNFVYPIRKSSMAGQSSISWWLSKISLGFIVSSLMALIQVTTMLLLGLPAYSVLTLYITALVTSWCYMSIVMFLAMTFDNPGRFMAMILLVLQLGGSAGTFPIQTQGKFFQIIHPFLPMSYSLYAFRGAIAGGISNTLVTKSFIVMIVLTIVFITLLCLSMDYLQKHHLRDVSLLNDNQELLALEIDDQARLSSQIQTNIERENMKGEKSEHE